MGALIIIGVFAVTFILIVVVGFIGNKVVDGASNKMRERRIERREAMGENESPTESLAARFANVPNSGVTRIQQNDVLCPTCGARIIGTERFCRACGTMRGMKGYPSDKI